MGDVLPSERLDDTGRRERDDSGVDRRALAEAARRHDPAAWEAIYRSIYPRLRAYVARRVGPADAEDLVNETMTRAVAGVDRFTWGPAGIDGWLFGIARRVTADHARRAERERRAVQRISDGDHHAPVEENLELREDADAVRLAFEQLSPGERDLLELRVIAGLSSDEVAAVLGKRPGAVRMAQSRALTNLRRRLGER